MKKLLFLPSLIVLTACAHVGYSRTNPDGSRTDMNVDSIFSTSAFKGMVVDGNGKDRDSAGIRITGLATDPNAAAITATGDALGSLIGTAISKGAKP